jgi:Pyruvate/2-oxoacid:ferredoxin oxidoreductase gamma subunit
MIDVIGGSSERVARFCDRFPDHVAATDIALKLAGAGGDGAQTAAMLIAQAAINEGFDATHIPSYGPESRGGTSYADVHIAAEQVLSPSAPRPDILVAFNAPSLAKFGPSVKTGGTIVFDSSVIADPPPPPEGVRQVGVPFTGIAVELGKPVVKNVVALGALQAATRLFPEETFLTSIRHALRDKSSLLALNEEAFARGRAGS